MNRSLPSARRLSAWSGVMACCCAWVIGAGTLPDPLFGSVATCEQPAKYAAPKPIINMAAIAYAGLRIVFPCNDFGDPSSLLSLTLLSS